jgi:hypothetical protein
MSDLGALCSAEDHTAAEETLGDFWAWCDRQEPGDAVVDQLAEGVTA